MTAVAPSVARRVRAATFADVLRSEWTKLRSVRSTFWAFFVAAALGVGIGALISYLSARHYTTDPTVQFNWSPTDRSLMSLDIAQLAFAALGVMVISGEYSTGMIRTSLAAVPKRSWMLAAKCAVFTVVALVVGEAISFAAFSIGQALISGKAPSASLGYPGVLRAVVGSGLYLAAIALLGTAVGTLLRHAAAGIGVMVAILFVLPGIILALPESWSRPLEKYWPTNAGSQIASVGRPIRDFGLGHALGPWQGFGVMMLFVVVVLAGAFYFLERRDA